MATAVRLARALPALLALAACVRQPTPAPAGSPAPAAAAERSWRFAYAPGSYTYLFEQSAVIDLTGDTTSMRDSVRTSAVFHYRLTSTPTGTAAAGTIDSFQVTAGRLATVQRPLAEPVAFEAVVDTAAQRVSLRGPLADTTTATDCSSPARTLAIAGRDLLVALPPLLEQGQAWDDTTSSVTCRGNIPIRNRIAQRYVVEGRDGYAGVSAVRLRRTARTTLTGSASPRGQAVSLSGEGTAETRLWVDPATGRLLGAAGEATTRFTLSAAGQTRNFTQRAIQRISLRGI